VQAARASNEGRTAILRRRIVAELGMWVMSVARSYERVPLAPA